MIVVKVYFNTQPNGDWVDWEKEDADSIHAPVCIFGPFGSMDEAGEWMQNNYVDDTDVYDMEAEEDFEVPEGWHINNPEGNQDEVPDVDIRTDDETLPG